MLSCVMLRHLSCFCDFRRLTPCGLSATGAQKSALGAGTLVYCRGERSGSPSAPSFETLPARYAAILFPTVSGPCGPKYALFGALCQRGWDLSPGGREDSVRVNSRLRFGCLFSHPRWLWGPLVGSRNPPSAPQFRSGAKIGGKDSACFPRWCAASCHNRTARLGFGAGPAVWEGGGTRVTVLL